MPSYQDKKTKKWYCKFYYENYLGETQQKKKSGFARKKEADKWEDDFLANHAKTPDMPFKTLTSNYLKDSKTRVKPATHAQREGHVKTYISPAFEKKKVSEITPLMVREWQNELMDETDLVNSSIRAIHVTLSGIFNYGKNFYGTSNPASRAGNVKASPKTEMAFYTLDEFKIFQDKCQLSPVYLLIIKLLFWSGIRIGELQALTVKDINFNKNTIKISKTFVAIENDIGDTPKTENSNRIIKMPEEIMKEFALYAQKIYDNNEPIFRMSRGAIRNQLNNGWRNAGLHKIRIHDLRGSQASLMINLGYSILAVAKRLGDTPEMILKVYGHLYDDKEEELIQAYDSLLQAK